MLNQSNQPALRAKHSTVASTPTERNTVHTPRVAKIDVLRKTDNGLVAIAKYSCEYLSLSNLFCIINGFFCTGEHYPELPDALRINFNRDEYFYWNFNLAHYCFAHGHLEVEELLDAMLPKLNDRRAAV
jgi:hypothetical protein